MKRRGEERRGKERIVFNYISQCIHWHHTSQLLIFLAMHWKQLIWRLIVGPFLIPLHVTAVFAGLAALSHLLLEYSASVSSIGPKWKQASAWLTSLLISYWNPVLTTLGRQGWSCSLLQSRQVSGGQSVLSPSVVSGTDWEPQLTA